MNHKSTLYLLLLSCLLCSSFAGFSQNAYRSKQTGANYSWTTVANWETFNGTAWVPASAYPVSTDGIITISAADSITLSTAITTDQIVVDGILAIFSSTQTLNDGPGVDLQVNGKLHMGLNGVLSGTGSLQVNASGTLSFLLNGARVRTTTTNNGSTIVANPTGTTGIEINSFTNNGTFTINSGTFSINNCELINNNLVVINSVSPASYIVSAGTAPAGQLNNTAAGTVSKPNAGSFSIGRFSNAGLVKGIGSIDIPTMPSNTGRLEPGNSAGSIGVPANFFTGKTPTLNLEIIDGSGPGLGHDEVNITGAANLSGTTINIAGNDIGAPAGPYTVLAADANFIAPPSLANIHVAPGYTVTINANNIVINKNIVLPVSWGGFDAFDEADKVRLLWSTVQEIDASHFIVEYSTDGSSFAPLARISASGNSNVEKRYSYSHNSPSATGTNFYRLKQVDVNGKYAYSKTVTIKLKTGGRPVVTATPNPVRNSLQIFTTQPNFKLVLSDLNGRTLKTLQLGQGSQYLDVNDLPAGSYFLLFSDGERSFSQKIIKTR